MATGSPNPMPSPICPVCHRPMRLFGIEQDHERRTLYTFSCASCDEVEVKTAEIKAES
jgi:hypothetical protein